MGVIIHRSRQVQQYVVVPNAIARDKRLSFRARGLLVMLLSLPPDWHLTTDMLAEDNPDSRTAIRAAMLELREAGYVKIHREQGSKGRWRTRLEVFDTPQRDAPRPASGATSGNGMSSQVAPNATPPAAGQPAAGQPAPNRSTGPKYGTEVREKDQGQDHPVANPEDHRVHDGPDDQFPPTPDGQAAYVGEQPQTVTRAREAAP